MTALSPGSGGTLTATADPSVKTATLLEFLIPTFNAEQYSALPLLLK
jgi:hypothetical protein